ncbi:MAG TPA: DUF4256 domain-containing protein [Bacteroidales bacterium]|nr:DUF4256 domain-containing protein [Bacteroidales bacterium]
MKKLSEYILSSDDFVVFLGTLKYRFAKNSHYHPGIAWQDVQIRLESYATGNALQQRKLWSLHEMERTGGEPNVVDYNPTTGAYVFFDCSPESPTGRRSLCYDDDALYARKEFKPANSAMEMAMQMGVELMDEAQYNSLQQLGVFDAKSSSWIKTPEDFRSLGGGLFGHRRFGRVFINANGAQSYYSDRGFRSVLMV